MAVRLAQHLLGDLPRHGLLPRTRDPRRRRGHERTEPSPHRDRALLLERPVGVLDGVRIDLQLRRERADRRQGIGRLENAHRHTPLHLVHDLSENRTGVGRINAH